eukprot:TRINITY_DN3570_c0_g1_i4.p4 TRINITY_DN3570_c0_g1~~TRINITY_DN3570_c0_g1_i4.p4  ORF type:complete len:154 (-),score=7.54 TRINITY_DN3570_c0_g1_i4:1144-1605(-)
MYYMQHLNTQNFKWLSTTIVQILHPKFLILSLPNQGKHSCLQNNALETKLKKVTLRTHELIKKNINSPSIFIYPQNHLALKKKHHAKQNLTNLKPNIYHVQLKTYPDFPKTFFQFTFVREKNQKKKPKNWPLVLKNSIQKKVNSSHQKKSSNY